MRFSRTTDEYFAVDANIMRYAETQIRVCIPTLKLLFRHFYYNIDLVKKQRTTEIARARSAQNKRQTS